MTHAIPSPDDVDALVEEIRPLLANRNPDLVGAALADLTAILLAGHVVLDDLGEVDVKANAQFREALIEIHITAVRRLIPINEAMIMEQRRSKAVAS